jgi:4-amino-4-deoxy-L-arabinose transferase-like glycosyltransferase
MREGNSRRLTDYAVLTCVMAALTLPNLGSPSLWDVDEGVNAEAAREMREAGTWVIPTFNFELRTAKPVMLYWLQRVSYAAFGVSEWSARLPSAVAGWLTLLLVYELARRMFGPSTGLLAGFVLASAIEFCMLTHAATPDATLLFFTTLAFYLFWIGHENGSRKWWLPTAAACGLAMLTKGPVGIALPGLVILLYLAWNRELYRLWDRRLIAALLTFIFVAGPWYGLVASETRGAWAKAFFLNENLNRALNPMEDHSGPIFYHALALLVLFAPWSIFLGVAVWYGARETFSPRSPLRQQEEALALPGKLDSGSVRPSRFLICWFAGYLLFFSLVRTKLPNYVLPLYPAIAILTARFLIRWRDGELTAPRWVMPAAVAGLLVVAVGFSVALLAAGGIIPIAGNRTLPRLEYWSLLGALPLVGAILMARALRQGNRHRFVVSATAASLVFVGLLAAFPSGVMDQYKAPRELARKGALADTSRDLRIAAFDWFQPSVVFYARRQVLRLDSPGSAVEFLAVPTPGFLIIPEPTWNAWIAAGGIAPYREVTRQFDFYRNCNVLVISNEQANQLVSRVP